MALIQNQVNICTSPELGFWNVVQTTFWVILAGGFYYHQLASNGHLPFLQRAQGLKYRVKSCQFSCQFINQWLLNYVSPDQQHQRIKENQHIFPEKFPKTAPWDTDVLQDVCKGSVTKRFHTFGQSGLLLYCSLDP